jgi:hypothetical protein
MLYRLILLDDAHEEMFKYSVILSFIQLTMISRFE